LRHTRHLIIELLLPLNITMPRTIPLDISYLVVLLYPWYIIRLVAYF
jgi:hypothetical protein